MLSGSLTEASAQLQLLSTRGHTVSDVSRIQWLLFNPFLSMFCYLLWISAICNRVYAGSRLNRSQFSITARPVVLLKIFRANYVHLLI